MTTTENCSTAISSVALVPATSRVISAVAASAILAILVQFYAGASLRGLYADGAYYAVELAAHRAFTFLDPARATGGVIIQWPVVHLGVETPHGFALVFSFITNLLPGLIILLCLQAMPTAERHFFIFPCFVYFAGILSGQFASHLEGHVYDPGSEQRDKRRRALLI